MQIQTRTKVWKYKHFFFPFCKTFEMLRHAEPDFPKRNLVLLKFKGPMKWKMACVSLGEIQYNKVIVAYFYVTIPFSSHKVSFLFFSFQMAYPTVRTNTKLHSMRSAIMGEGGLIQPTSPVIITWPLNTWTNIPSHLTSNHRQILQSNRHFMGPLHAVDVCWDALAHYYSNTLGRPRKLSHWVVNANEKQK